MSEYARSRMRRVPEPPLGLIVFTVGLSILGAEIAAARLLAPYFGASTIVWANTIGIVLVALSAGYWYGGWASRSTRWTRSRRARSSARCWR